MKMQHTFTRLFLSSLTLSALVIGGCADNGNVGSNSAQKSLPIADQVQVQRISCESNDSEIPNIFADCLSLQAGKASGAVSRFDDSFASRRNADEEGKLPALSTNVPVPARVEASIAAPYVIAEKDNAVGKLICDLDVKGVELQGGTRYTITFEDVDHSGLSCLDFQPLVRIVSQADYLAGNLNDCLELELIAPDPQNRYVSLSFVAPQDGKYCVTVSDNTTTPSSQPIEEDFCYTIYPDANKVGMGLILTDEINGQEIAFTNEEVQDLRCALRPYIESWDNGFPSKLSDKAINGQTWKEALDETVARIKLGHSGEVQAATGSPDSVESSTSSKAVKAANSSASKTVLEPIVDKQAWDSATMDLGYGFEAVSGRPARKISAIQSFTLPKERKPFSADTYMRLIENSTQQEKAMGVSLSGTFSGSSVTVNSSVSTRDVYKYSATSTTLQIFYENCDIQPSKLDINDYKLTDAAKALLVSDPDAFRATYGDYFVAGTYYGAKYVGNIAIRTTSTEQLNTIKQKLSTVVAGQKVDEEFTKELKNVLKNCDIALSVHTEGGSDVGGNGGSGTTLYFNAADNSWTADGPVFANSQQNSALSIDALIQGYQNFKKSVETNPNPNLAPVYAYMLEFSQIPDCEQLSDELPVDPEVFINIRNICRDYLRLTSTINEYCGLPDSDFRYGRNHLQQVRADYDDLSIRFKAALRTSGDNTDSFISTWSQKIKEACKTADARLERYYFVRRLSEANAAIAKSDLHPNRNVLFGYSQYLHSQTCNNDFIGVSDDSMHKSWKVGRHTWYPRLTCKTSYQGIAAGIEWTNHSNCDKCSFTYFPPLCRRTVGVDCKGGYDRDVNWDLKVYWINADNYKELILPNERT